MHAITKERVAELEDKCLKIRRDLLNFIYRIGMGHLGSAVAEALCEEGLPMQFKRIGLPDKFALLGPLDEVYAYYGLDRNGILASILNMTGKR